MAADGKAIPRLGFGTYGRRGGDGTEAILAALKIGYRHLDTAQSYGTEVPVGEAVRRSGLPRSEVFVTTKVQQENFRRGRFLPSVRKSLEDLGFDYVDLLLIHWPSPRNAVPLEDYLLALQEAQSLGLAKQIGVSNFTIALIDQAEAILGPGTIATNQIEIHPFLQNRKLRAHCVSLGITPTAYLPLAHGRVASDPVIRAIANTHRADPGQIALAFLLQQDLIAIPATSRTDRMRSNFEATRIQLSDDEMAKITSLERGARQIDMADAAWD
jgi:2,5-diketo-D-gluconate reductase B